MADEESGAPVARRLEHFNGANLVRLGLWTLAAGVSVAVAVFIGTSDIGLRRLSTTFAALQGVPSAQPREGAARDTAMRDPTETQRLTESLRQLNADRTRMVERLEAIERHLDDITGSINRSITQVRAPEAASTTVATTSASVSPSTSTQDQSNPTTGSVGTQATPTAPATSVQPAGNVQQQDAATTEPASPKVEFGIDLGGAQTIDGLRVLWTNAKGKHATILENLRPIISVREAARAGHAELRLVAGPVPSAALAARLCSAITATGSVCQPAVFDGQRLALR